MRPTSGTAALALITAWEGYCGQCPGMLPRQVDAVTAGYIRMFVMPVFHQGESAHGVTGVKLAGNGGPPSSFLPAQSPFVPTPL